MFTGIVEDVGIVKSIESKSKDQLFNIKVKNIVPKEIELGESISVNGTCLTVTSVESDCFTVSASHETLKITNLTKLSVGAKVNLERSLKVGGRVGGHIVNGHIDGIARVLSISKRGDSFVVWFTANEEHTKYIVKKGSIAVDGVSLTVNEVEGNSFSVNIIPFTQKATIYAELKVGNTVNIECDIIGKYVEKFLSLENKKDKLSDLIKEF